MAWRIPHPTKAEGESPTKPEGESPKSLYTSHSNNKETAKTKLITYPHCRNTFALAPDTQKIIEVLRFPALINAASLAEDVNQSAQPAPQ